MRSNYSYIPECKFCGLLLVGFPAILAQFPETPQFRSAGWFCVAAGVAVLLLQLALFHGECTWHCSSEATHKEDMKEMPSFEKGKPWHIKFCMVFVSKHYNNILEHKLDT